MREIININEGWSFSKEQKELPIACEESWEVVDLPHTWNQYDGQDGGSDYYRGACWYVKELGPYTVKPHSRIYLEFQAAANVCVAYVNGKKVCSHEGGFSIFRADITEQLDENGENLIAVCVDNAPKSNVYPQMADFTFYGGLYRDVNLVIVNESHFDLDYYGAPGIKVSSKIQGENALVDIHSYVTNPLEGDRVEFEIYDEDGETKVFAVRPATQETQVAVELLDAHLWQGVEDPYLYTVSARLVRHNEVLDEIETRIGIREYTVDPQKGFFLNGKSMPLRGVSRHQDRYDLGNALTFEEHYEDILLIKEVGANTIRLAHYQHSQDFYDLCDEAGFIIWAEIPFISAMNADPDAHENCRSQMRELIFQNFNHPSICFWGISNEITIGGEVPGLVENLKDLHALVHELDDTRMTTMAQVSHLPMENEQNDITDVVSYNHYFGWYGGKLEDNEAWLDAFHEMHPERPIGISEYGCEGITTYHNDNPKGGDYSEEFQAVYHEHMAKIIEERPWLWATHVWNMFDFGCDARNEGGVKGRNNKGLMTIDRLIRKDAFYLYKAYWTEEEFVHICSKRYAQRTTDTVTIKVYTNCPEVTLSIGGRVIEKQAGNKVFTFENVPLQEGFTTIVAKAGNCTDTITLEKVAEANPSYIFEESEDDKVAGVTNWFDNVDLSVVRPMEFKEGYFSLKDLVKDILKNTEACQVLLNGLSSTMGINIKKSMLEVMGDRPAMDMGANSGDEKKMAVMAYINTELQKIKKED